MRSCAAVKSGKVGRLRLCCNCRSLSEEWLPCGRNWVMVIYRILRELSVRKIPALLLALLLTGCFSEAPDDPAPQQDDSPVVQRAEPDDVNTIPADEPTDEAGFRKRGNAYFSQGDYDRAIDDYTVALSLKAHPGAFYNRGVAHTAKNEFDEA